jgi:hypothetical protein
MRDRAVLIKYSSHSKGDSDEHRHKTERRHEFCGVQRRVEAGLNSEEDTKNWKAGNALGQALKEEGETTEPIYEKPVDESSTPLFMRDSPGGRMGNAQDEKDETEE